MSQLAVGLLDGISFGVILFLISSGLSLIFGTAGILNFAHGALYMIGSYVGWLFAVKIGLNFWLAVILGGLAGGFLGLVLERGFFRYLYKMPDEQVLLSISFVYIMVNLCQWVFGPVPKPPFAAPSLSGHFTIMGRWYPVYRLALILIGIVLALGLWWLQEKTRAGAIVRAGMEDKEMTVGLGINYGLVATAVFFLGCFMAGFAGVLGSGLIGPNLDLGWDTLLWAIIVLVIGGMGSVQGALVGAILIGLIDYFGKALFPEFAMFTIYVAMIAILLVRPSGLLGRRF